MINWNDFESAVINLLNRNIDRNSAPQQNAAIGAPPSESLFIPAGPGSGKTTVIALKVLKLILVDGVDPSNIIVTTFTRRAAHELRSRILGWGDQLRTAFMQNPSYRSTSTQLAALNLNNIITGTIDSIIEEILSDPSVRSPGMPSPTVISDFASDSLMGKVGLFRHGRFRNPQLEQYMSQLKGFYYQLSMDNKRAFLISLKDRFFHDQIDVNQFRNGVGHNGACVACDAIEEYCQELTDRFLYDFATLEQQFLDHIQAGTLNAFLSEIEFILVDEYQDTNLLQERIYFELARVALHHGGSITVVGDDDQSLYRFRGAIVDLFQNFPNSLNNQLNVSPTIIHLSQNYRSTDAIVTFCNQYIHMDSQYQPARVRNKPSVTPSRQPPYIDFPILGMFRDDVNELAENLARLINDVINGNGIPIQDTTGTQQCIQINAQGGSPVDIAFLASSPAELAYNGNPRLPRLLRNELNRLPTPIQVFNPRGQHLQLIPDVQRLCGLVLECIDPVHPQNVQNSITNLPQSARNMFDLWRREANNYIRTNPQPRRRRTLRQFVNSWRTRTSLGRPRWDQREVSLIDLIYKLVTWIPSMRNDIEGLVYLEAITRTITETSLFNSFLGNIVTDSNRRQAEQSSIREAYWDIFVPIATGAIQINEDLLETLPSDRINILSIHQAKGLEFPLTIVDVGSDYRDRRSAAFKRFPIMNSRGRVDKTDSVNLEDELRSYSPLGASQRASLDRAFDDLIRHYYVSFSRAQDVLLLVGLNSVCIGYTIASGYRQIPNVATGWTRAPNWSWGVGLRNLTHISV